MPLSEAETSAILEPLRLACAIDLPRLQEPALGCLHKLVCDHVLVGCRQMATVSIAPSPNTLLTQVAHTYLQGESSHAGALTDGTTVSTVRACCCIMHVSSDL